MSRAQDVLAVYSSSGKRSREEPEKDPEFDVPGVAKASLESCYVICASPNIIMEKAEEDSFEDMVEALRISNGRYFRLHPDYPVFRQEASHGINNKELYLFYERQKIVGWLIAESLDDVATRLAWIGDTLDSGPDGKAFFPWNCSIKKAKWKKEDWGCMPAIAFYEELLSQHMGGGAPQVVTTYSSQNPEVKRGGWAEKVADFIRLWLKEDWKSCEKTIQGWLRSHTIDMIMNTASFKNKNNWKKTKLTER